MGPLDWIAEELRFGGLTVSESGGWKTRGFAGFAPKSVMVHHTATGGDHPAPSLNLVIAGRKDLKGPLCNLLIGRDGVVHVIATGVANHAGSGSRPVLAALLNGQPLPKPAADDYGGNSSFVGIEVENNGVGEAYPPAQIHALIRSCAVICKHYGWGPKVLHHREWTRRKIDMSWRGDIRALVTADLRNKPATSPTGVIKTILLGDDMQRHTLNISTDENGNGWLPLADPFNKLIALFPLGPFPPDDDYWNAPTLSAQERDGKTIIVTTEGPPNSSVTVYASFAA